MPRFFLFKIKTKIRRIINRCANFNRPASYPFISGDGFRTISNFILDQFSDFKPHAVHYGDTVFVRTDFLDYFFNNLHPQIKHPYVLITHNEDSPVDVRYEKYIDNKILHWYAQNLMFIHKKVTLLPIGVQNFTTGPQENFIYSYLKVNIAIHKKTKILFGFSLHPNIPERQEAYDALLKSKLSDKITTNRYEYYTHLSKYKFIASPAGGGIDCHRTWEALYFRVIPILLKSPFSEQLRDLGFPALLIEKWSDVSDLTEKSLDRFYEQESIKFKNEKLHLDYWYNSFSKFRNNNPAI